MAEIVVFCDVCGTGINLLVGDKVALCKKCGKKVCAGCAEKEGAAPQCYCSECVAKCCSCGVKKRSESLKKLDADEKIRLFCDSCYEKFVKVCHACKKPTIAEGMAKVGDGLDWEFYCKACVPKEVDTCTKCGNSIHSKDITKVDKTLGKTQLLCKGCYDG
jgi:hypothetical protein